MRHRRPHSGCEPTPTVGSPDAGVCALTDLEPGMRGRILGSAPRMCAETTRRLAELGFAPGAEVTVLRRAPLGDPVLFEVCEYEIALRAGQARDIRVRRLP